MHLACNEIDHAIQQRSTRGRGLSILLLGPSGCGKSTVLRALACRVRRRGWRVLVVRPARNSPRPIVDLFGGSAEHAIAALARAGLGEAMLLPRRAAELSDGERARLSLALALSTLEKQGKRRSSPVLLAVDEFTSILDRVTARGVARVLSRVVAQTDVILVAASPHEDVAQWLSPDVVACGELGVGGQWTITSASRAGNGRTTSPSNGSTTAPRHQPPRSAS